MREEEKIDRVVDKALAILGFAFVTFFMVTASTCIIIHNTKNFCLFSPNISELVKECWLMCDVIVVEDRLDAGCFNYCMENGGDR